MSDLFLRRLLEEGIAEQVRDMTDEAAAQRFKKDDLLKIVFFDDDEHNSRLVVFKEMCKSEPKVAIVTFDNGEKELRVHLQNLMMN